MLCRSAYMCTQSMSVYLGLLWYVYVPTTSFFAILLMVNLVFATQILHFSNEVRLNFPWHLLFLILWNQIEFPSGLQIKLPMLILIYFSVAWG